MKTYADPYQYPPDRSVLRRGLRHGSYTIREGEAAFERGFSPVWERVPHDRHRTDDLVLIRFDRAGPNHLFHRFTLGPIGIIWRQFLSERGDLDDQRRNPVVESSHDQRSTTTETLSPQSNASRIDFVERGCKRDRVAIPPRLGPRVNLLAGLATARTEASMVEEQHGQARLSEDLRGSISAADLSATISLVAENPWAMTTSGQGGSESGE